MLRRLLIVLALVQLADLVGLVWLGRQLGFLQTFALVLLSGMLGSALARREGLRVWRGWNTALNHGRAPEEGIIAGMLVLLAGVLLVAPGLATDVIALLLLLPITRKPIAALIARNLRSEFELRTGAGAPFADRGGMFSGDVFSSNSRDSDNSDASGRVDPDVIETTGVETRAEADAEPRSQRIRRALSE